MSGLISDHQAMLRTAGFDMEKHGVRPFIDRWRDLAFSTEPMDRQACTAAAEVFYKAIGRPMGRVVFARSRAEGYACAAALCAGEWIDRNGDAGLQEQGNALDTVSAARQAIFENLHRGIVEALFNRVGANSMDESGDARTGSISNDCKAVADAAMSTRVQVPIERISKVMRPDLARSKKYRHLARLCDTMFCRFPDARRPGELPALVGAPLTSITQGDGWWRVEYVMKQMNCLTGALPITLLSMASSCDCALFHRNFIVFCDRAEVVHTEEVVRFQSQRPSRWMLEPDQWWTTEPAQSIGRRLHRDDGPAVVWRDGTKAWYINGVDVDEQVVMDPKNQPLDLIVQETNVERRRIRIDRYGWDRYIVETATKVVDHRSNDVDNQDEVLVEDLERGGRVLVVSDPSTGRVYPLRVPNDINTCAEAQDWMSCGLSRRMVHRS